MSTEFGRCTCMFGVLVKRHDMRVTRVSTTSRSTFPHDATSETGCITMGPYTV
jgi:hypothetical protein